MCTEITLDKRREPGDDRGSIDRGLDMSTAREYVSALMQDNANLRAELAALKAQEPVATVFRFSPEYGACASLLDGFRGLPDGTKLYAAPAVSAEQQGVADGWKLAPLKPTQEMNNAFHAAISTWLEEIGHDDDVYKAMLAAAPAPSTTEGQGDGMCNEENPAQRCICREEFGHRVCGITPAPAHPVSAQPAGEVPEVVVWRCKRLQGREWVYDYSRHKACVYCEELMTVAQHTRIVAALQARAVVMPEWISVRKRLPDVGDLCLIRIPVCGYFEVEGAKYKGDGDWYGAWCSTKGRNQTYKVSHWMPAHDLLSGANGKGGV
jgi:hypothetical protein